LPPRVYYDSGVGNFVRADVVYLRQDFSVLQPVENHGKWPRLQRYLVRQREVSAEEAECLAADLPDPSPHREAVLFALRALTGRDAGSSSAAWRQLIRAMKDEEESE
jgi:hypothetical protein